MKYFIIVLLMQFSIAKADVLDYIIPDYVVSETGGYVGFYSIGIGYTYFDLFNYELIYGYVPDIIGGEELELVTLRYYVESYGVRLGLGGVFSLRDNDTFNRLPSQYPKGYYPATGMYSTLFLGYEHDIDNRLKVFAEITTLDYYLEAASRSGGYLELYELGTYGLGVKYALQD